MPLILSGNTGTSTLDSSTGLTFSDSSLQGAAASPYVLKNRIINGDMRIDQRNAGASVTADGNAVFPVDRWKIEDATDGVFTGQQVSDAPTGASYSLKVTITTADTSLGATQYASCYQLIEGYNTADLAWGTANAKTVTLSFWAKSSLTGTFGGSVTNSGWGSTYPFTYTISSANTWEYKTVTIPGSTTGTWLTTNGQGIGLFFGLGVGADYSGTAGAWTTGVKISATGATSVIGTNSATWQISLVQLEIGTSATPFERRLYNQELANCYRYFYKLGGPFNDGSSSYMHYGIGWWYTTTLAFVVTTFPVTMRASPSFSVTNPTNFYVNTNGAVSAINVDQVSRQTCDWYATGPTSTVNSATRVYGINGTVNSVQFDAEL